MLRKILEKEREGGLEINIREERGIVEIWLTGAERDDPAARGKLQALYEKFKGKKYCVAQFESGGEELAGNALALLRHNVRRGAELAGRREKGLCGAHESMV